MSGECPGVGSARGGGVSVLMGGGGRGKVG
jgi:hypothetical protein